MHKITQKNTASVTWTVSGASLIAIDTVTARSLDGDVHPFAAAFLAAFSWASRTDVMRSAFTTILLIISLFLHQAFY